jgi:valyl-tRNA synthetase
VFSNKVWNAAKLVIGNLEGVSPGAEPRAGDLDLADRWIRSRLALARDLVDSGLEGYRIQEAAKAIYDFFWHEFCDWYLELAKIRLYGQDETARNTSRLVAYQVLEASLKLLHPIMPFVTEDLWQRLPHEGVSIARAPWPAPGPRDHEAEADMEFLMQAIVAVRTIRSEMNVPPGREAEVLAHAEGRAAELLAVGRPMFATLARARLTIDPRAERPAFAASAIVGECELFVPLKGLIDLEVERRRLEKERDRVEKERATAEARLESRQFLDRAPAAVVARERERLAELGVTRAKLARNLAALGEG